MSGIAKVYKWELLKLTAQKRTYLGVGAAILVPIAFVVALVFSLAGDVFLMLPDEDRWFAFGLGSFLLGHIAFVVMFADRGFDRWPIAGVAVAGCALLLGTVFAHRLFDLLPVVLLILYLFYAVINPEKL